LESSLGLLTSPSLRLFSIALFSCSITSHRSLTLCSCTASEVDEEEDDCDDPNSECAKEKKKEEDCEKLDIADNVYNTENGLPDSENVGLSNGNTILLNPNSQALSGLDINYSNDNGFNSALYKIEHENGSTEIVYSFAGTDDFNDLVADVSQAFGFSTEQYNIAIENAREAYRWADENGYTLSFTGHSLGGRLATVAALATGLDAFVFNPAGIHDNTITEHSLNVNNAGNISGVNVFGEIVTGLNAISPNVHTYGNIDTIVQEDPIVPGPGAISSLLLNSTLAHLVSALKSALGCQ